MAKRKSTALTSIVKEAKSLKRKYPHRYDRLKKSERWSKGYIKQASAIYASGHGGKSPVGKKRKKKHAVGVAKKKPVKRSRKRGGRKVIKQVERRSVERVMAGKRKKRRSTRRPVVMAGKRRSVGKSGNSMIVGLAIGAGLLYLLTRGKSAPTTPTYPNLPALTNTSNYTRNTQSQDLVNYAIAAGLAANAISSLIHSLNSSSDQQVQSVYNDVQTGGDISNYV